MYRPDRWPMEHRVALAIAIALGAGLAMFVGFVISGRSDFAEWAFPRLPERYMGTNISGAPGHGIYWAVPGAICGAACVYLVKLLR